MQGNYPSLQQASASNSQDSHLLHPSLYKIPTNSPMPHGYFINSMPAAIQTSMAVRDLHISFQNNFQNMLALKLRNDLEGQIIRSQFLQMFKAQCDLQAQYSLKGLGHSGKTNSENTLNVSDSLPNSSLRSLCDTNKSTKAHLKDILYFILDNVGMATEEELNAEKSKYRNDRELTTIFDVLLSKYVSAVKTKEEMEKYVLRKALKYMQLKNRRESKKQSAQGSVRPSHTNFPAFLEYISAKTGELEDHWNSTKKARQDINETTITEVIDEAFACEEFCYGFEEFVQIMNKTVELENNKKIDRFVKHIEASYSKDITKDIKKYKRIPWLKAWIQSSKKIAHELASVYRRDDWHGQNKIVKKEEYVQKLEALSESTFSAKIEESLT